MGNDVVDALINEKKGMNVYVQGKEYCIGKLTTIQYLRLGKFVSKIAAKYAPKLVAFKSTENELGDVVQFTEMLDENDFLEFLSISLNVDDKELCGIITGDEALDIVTAVCEYNDLGLMLKKVQGVIRKIKQQFTNIQTKNS